MESSESRPLSALLSIGTPSTGRTVCDAHIPGRCAAPPAPAMITSMPRDSADFENSNKRSGVRWAETIFVSCGTLNSSSVSAATFIVDQSVLLPMMIETIGFLAISILRKLGSHNQFKLIPSRNRAAPKYDFACPVDDDVLWKARKNKRVHRRFCIGCMKVFKGFFREILFNIARGIGRHSQKNDIGTIGKSRSELVKFRFVRSAYRTADKPEIQHNDLAF